MAAKADLARNILPPHIPFALAFSFSTFSSSFAPCSHFFLGVSLLGLQVCNGVLPIDQLKLADYIAPVTVVCQRISREQLQHHYGVKFPLHTKVDAHMLLTAYASA
jgi:hypothetical protein